MQEEEDSTASAEEVASLVEKLMLAKAPMLADYLSLGAPRPSQCLSGRHGNRLEESGFVAPATAWLLPPCQAHGRAIKAGLPVHLRERCGCCSFLNGLYLKMLHVSINVIVKFLLPCSSSFFKWSVPRNAPRQHYRNC